MEAASSAAAVVAVSADLGMKVEAVAVVGGEVPEEEEEGRDVAQKQKNLVHMMGGGGGLKKGRRERGGCTAKERISKMTPCVAGKRSSIYRGVTRHRWTGRYEAHLWDKSTWNQNQNKKGKQVYLGAYDDEEAAARAYDLAALKYWGAGTLINFPVSDYSRDLEEMQMISKEDYLVSLRRKSSAFSRGFPKYRGLSRQVQSSRWDGSLSQINGANKDPAAMEREYGSGFCMERKIDLTSYIRWWGSNKTHQSDAFSEDIARELRKFECLKEPTEPYQLPSLGIHHHRTKPHSSPVTACGILSRSAAFKNLLHKSSETLDDIRRKESIGHGKTNPILFRSGGTGIDRPGTTPVFSEFPLQRAPLLSAAPLRTPWNPIDPLPDPIFWTSLVPAGPSLTSTLRKVQTNSADTFNYQQ